VDPTNLLVTYAHEHNHSLPLPKSHHSSTTTATTTITAAVDTPSPGESPATTPQLEEQPVFITHPDFDLTGDHHAVFGWFDDIVSTGVLVSPICGGVEDVTLTMREEDESLFADLGELPECSTVFRQRNITSVFQYSGITG